MLEDIIFENKNDLQVCFVRSKSYLIQGNCIYNQPEFISFTTNFSIHHFY